MTKTESIRSNFNFQWTKTLYQNNSNNIAFFFTFFKGLLPAITPETEQRNVKFHKNCENTGKILKISSVRLPWVPEVFFLSFAAKIERRSLDRDEREKNPSGHGSYEPHFHEYRF